VPYHHPNQGGEGLIKHLSHLSHTNCTSEYPGNQIVDVFIQYHIPCCCYPYFIHVEGFILCQIFNFDETALSWKQIPKGTYRAARALISYNGFSEIALTSPPHLFRYCRRKGMSDTILRIISHIC